MKSYYRGLIGTHQRSFERYHPDPLHPPLTRDWGSQPNPKLQSLLSQERVQLWTANLAGTFTWSMKNLGEKGARAYPGSAGTAQICSVPLLSQEWVTQVKLTLIKTRYMFKRTRSLSNASA